LYQIGYYVVIYNCNLFGIALGNIKNARNYLYAVMELKSIITYSILIPPSQPNMTLNNKNLLWSKVYAKYKLDLDTSLK